MAFRPCGWRASPATGRPPTSPGSGDGSLGRARRPIMPYYLLQASYSRTGWAALVQNPHDRVAAVQTAAARLGGTLQGMYMSFGEYDVVAIYRMPDDMSAA